MQLMTFAIRVNNLSKQYRRGLTHAGSIRELVNRTVDRLRGRRPEALPHEAKGQTANGDDATFWALRDVSFDVRPGEVLGVIGRNGAGKSTLLKVLSRITAPTVGRVELHGRVGSLLEVGTGFHPELSGRENIFLNGAILGMTKPEIRRKFDEIVAFSEIEKFIDTPVKRYSSGMYVRLAFAVAAHLEPEILIIDEVLAVGDLAFQQKCLSHLRTLTGHGLTILLVSHNMAAIQSACQRVLFIDGGRVMADGQPLEVIECFRAAMQDAKEPTARNRMGSEGVTITGFELFGEDGKPTREVRFGESVRIRIDVHAERRIEQPMINFGLRRGDGVIICNFNNWYDKAAVDYLDGDCSMVGWLPPLRLVPDFYEIHVLVWPWGGAHGGDMMRSAPLATGTFGELRVVGPGLNAHDGVYQMPARKWEFHRGGQVAEFVIPADSGMEHIT